MGEMDVTLRPHAATSEHQSPWITEIQQTDEINVEIATQSDLTIDSSMMSDEQSVYNAPSSLKNSASLPVPVYAYFGHVTQNDDGFWNSFQEDAISSPPPTHPLITVERDDHDDRSESDPAYGEGELTSLTPPYDSFTTICASSPASKASFYEDEVSCNNLPNAEMESMRWTPPQSSSPLQDPNQTVIMSSPIRQTIAKEDEKDGSSITCPQSSPLIELKICDEHVNKLNDVRDVARSGKRKRSESLSALNQIEEPCPPESGLNSTYRNPIPNPKRLTVRSQYLQHEKLKTPFRSPLLIRSERHQGAESQTSNPAESDGMSEPSQATSKALPSPSNGAKISKRNVLRDKRAKYGTVRAAAQFKSPLPSDATLKLGNMMRMTPDVQVLERRSQLLKRALKIQQDDQEHVLEDLVRKWTDAGREVAWELWSLVKDKGTSEYDCIESPWSSTVQGWGWNESTNEKHNSEHLDMSSIESGFGDNHDPHDSDPEEELIQKSLGIMLRQLGIDPQTFGWDEGEGIFVDN